MNISLCDLQGEPGIIGRPGFPGLEGLKGAEVG